MAANSSPPFRADHVGSLLRPPELHEAREKVRLGSAPAAELKQTEDRLIREVVKLQEDVGLPSVTDGEFRRDWWHIDFLHGFDGVDLTNEGDVYFDTRFKGADPKDRKSTRLNSSHSRASRMPSSA